MIYSKQPIRKDEMKCLGSWWLIFVLHCWPALGPLFPPCILFRDVICDCVVQAGLFSSFFAFFSLVKVKCRIKLILKLMPDLMCAQSSPPTNNLLCLWWLFFPFLRIWNRNKKQPSRASLVAQWLRIHLPRQGTRVRALVPEDPTCRRATKPACHNY